MKLETNKPTTKYENTAFRSYLFCVLLRIGLVFVPQTGYIHPDEFFQSVEVILGDQFNIEHDRTWEFNNTSPIRSVSIPHFTLKIPLNFLQFLSFYTNYYFRIDLRNSYVFLVFPRLIMCVLSFLNDLSLYSICKVYSLKYDTRLLALGSSFVMLVFGTRTFSNTLEMTLCSVLLYFVSDCMIHSNTVIYKSEVLQIKYENAKSASERVKIYKLRAALPPHSLNRVVLMATLCVIGVFNRPTFLIFGAPMVFFWLLRGLGTKSVSFVDFNVRITLFVLCTIPTMLLFTLIDSLYYGYLTTGEIRMLDVGIENFVFTPWNFVKYNLDSSKTAQHGVHPRYLHMLVNVPLLYNILGVIAIFSFFKLTFRFLSGDYRHLPRSQSIIGLMTSAIFGPLAIMSCINHQEARFLLPLTLPVVLLHGHHLDGIALPNPFRYDRPRWRSWYAKIVPHKIKKKTMLRIWLSVNTFLVFFYGFLHQGGVYQLSSYFSDVMKTKFLTTNVHLVTSHMYSFPLAFVNTPSSKKIYVDYMTRKKYRRKQQFFVDELGSVDVTRILPVVSDILHSYKTNGTSETPMVQYQIYVAMPSSLCDEFEELYNKNISSLKFLRVRNFYPHLSMEAFPSLLQESSEDVIWTVSGLYSLIMRFVKQFGLALYYYES